MLMHCLNRKDNTMVLSEKLDENAVQTLLDLSIANKFPKQCDEWHSAKKNISDFYFREWTKKEQTAFEELATKEHEMRRVLYDALVGEVMALFPCVLFAIAQSHGMLRPQALISRSLEGDGLSSSHLQTRGDSNDVDSENSKSLSAFWMAHYVHQTRCSSQILRHPILIFRKSIEVISRLPSSILYRGVTRILRLASCA
jgi:hypothetical protein